MVFCVSRGFIRDDALLSSPLRSACVLVGARLLVRKPTSEGNRRQPPGNFKAPLFATRYFSESCSVKRKTIPSRLLFSESLECNVSSCVRVGDRFCALLRSCLFFYLWRVSICEECARSFFTFCDKSDYINILCGLILHVRWNLITSYVSVLH